MIHGRHHDWAEILGEVLGQPGRVRSHFQSIVDLERGAICGYEALARFTGAREVASGDLFAAAERLGLDAALEAEMVREALAAAPHLPDRRLLAVNVSPRALLSDEVARAFGAVQRLDRVIVELTEQSDADLGALTAVLDGLRARGALVAVDDVGAGYGSLTRITVLRPNFVKIDRGLVADIDREPARAAVVETLRDLAARMDAWLVAEGVERLEELEMLLDMQVPLGQGFVFGRPAPGMGELDAGLAAHLRATYRAPAAPLAVAALIESVPTLPEPVSGRALSALFDAHLGPEYVALVDAGGRPSGLVRRGDHARGAGPERSLMLVTPDVPLATAARRAMTRPSPRRFDPLICRDEDGRYTGVVRIERAIDALAAAA